MSVIDEFDPFPRHKPEDVTNTNQDPLFALANSSASASSSNTTASQAGAPLQSEFQRRASERRDRVFEDLTAQPWQNEFSYSSQQRQQSHYHDYQHAPHHTPRSPPRRLSSIMMPAVTSGSHEPPLVSMSPTEVPLYHADPKTPPHTVRKRLSTSLLSDDSSYFTSHRPSPPHESGHSQAQSASTAATAPATISGSSVSSRVRPALVGLFSSHSMTSSPTTLPEASTSGPSSSLGIATQHRSNTEPSPQRHRSPAPPAPIDLSSPPGQQFILNGNLAEALRPSLPSRLRIASKWTLLYSLDAHGVSLATLYARVEAGMTGRGISAGLLLVVKDDEGYVFGAFINEKLRRTDGFYGSGECFLWKETPFPKGDVRLGTGVKVFNWTGRNNYVVQSDNDFISVGGGRDGKFGLWIDASFEQGYSTRCLTFDNQILSGPDLPRPGATTPVDGGKRFGVNRVEVWRIGQ